MARPRLSLRPAPTVAADQLNGGPGRGPARLYVALTPDEFLAWARGQLRRAGGQLLGPPWNPGQHFACIGKTREGKTNFAIWLLAALRIYVLALDPKGEDETLTASGWTRVTTVPGGARRPRWQSAEWKTWRDIDDARAEGRPVRIIVGMQSRTREADAANRQLMRDAIEYARQAGGYTLLVDEHQILSDRRLYGLGEDIARQAISAARDGMSVVANMQYLAWVEKAATRQATLVALWRTRDDDMIKIASRLTGRPVVEIKAALDEMPKYYVLVITDELRAPMMFVRPPKVA